MPKLPGILLLSLLCLTLMGQGTTDSSAASADLKLTVDEVETGTLAFTLGWAHGNGSSVTYSSWEALHADLVADILNATGDEQAQTIASDLAGRNAPADAVQLLLQVQEGVVAATPTRMELTGQGLELEFTYILATGERLTLHPLAFVGRLENASAVEMSLWVTTSARTHVRSSHFVLNHIRMYDGETLGRDTGIYAGLETERAAYDPLQDSLYLGDAEQPYVPLTMTAILVLFIIGALVLLYQTGRRGVGGIIFPLLAVIFFLFVSLPYATPLFFWVVIFGLLKLIHTYRVVLAHREQKEELREGILDSIKGTSTIEQEQTLADLSGSGNVMARMYPFKITQLFFIYNDGRLLSTSTLKATDEGMDSKTVSSMLTAIQDFISDAFTTDEQSGLENVKYGKMHIFIQRVELAYIAGVIDGNAPDTFSGELKELLDQLIADNLELLTDWDGDTTAMEPIEKDMAKFIDYWST